MSAVYIILMLGSILIDSVPMSIFVTMFFWMDIEKIREELKGFIR